MKKWKMVATKRLGLDSKIKMGGEKPVTKVVTKINVERKDGKVEATGVTLHDGEIISRGEIEFAIDAEK